MHRQRLVLVLVLHRHWLVLVLLAAPPTAGAACAGAPPQQHVEVIVSRVVDAAQAHQTRRPLPNFDSPAGKTDLDRAAPAEAATRQATVCQVAEAVACPRQAPKSD